METETEINAAILKITTLIQVEYPELVKYLNEMPVTIPDVESPEINLTILKEYYNSLESLLSKYTPNHNNKITTL